MKHIAWAILIPLVSATAAAAETRLPQPHLVDQRIPLRSFGDADDVRLLASLLDDPDPRVREHATADLGTTDNPTALPHIRRGLADANLEVRQAAVTAAAQFPPRLSAKIVTAALADPDARMVWTALRAAVELSLKSAAPQLRALLARDAPALRMSALKTLTRLALPAEAGSLKTLLSAPSPAVRLAAAENASLLAPADAGGALADLTRLARRGTPAVRGAALAAMGKLDPTTAAELADNASEHTNPLVRRGAVRAFQHAGRKNRIRTFLADPSPMVRLAAVRAAGKLKCADCAEPIFTILLDAPFDDWFEKPLQRTPPAGDLHLAAREALESIATPQIAQLAARALAGTSAELVDRENRRVKVQYFKGAYDWSLSPDHFRDFDRFWRQLRSAGQDPHDAAKRRFQQLLPARIRTRSKANTTAILAALNAVLKRRGIYRPADFRHVGLPPEAREVINALHSQKAAGSSRDIAAMRIWKLNRLLLEAALPGEISPGPTRRRLGILRRNVMACSHLLGRLKHTPARDALLQLLKNLPVDSTALVAVCGALGRVGDAAAVSALTAVLKTCRRNGLKTMIAMAAQQPPPVPYEDRVAASVVSALGELRSPGSVAEILAIANLQYKFARLNAPAAAAAAVLPRFADASNRERIEAFLVHALAGEGYTMPVRYRAAVAAAAMKSRKTLPQLSELLTDLRHSRTMIHAAAWAIQEITGKTPPLTDPRRHPGNWSIRAIRR